MSKTVEFLEQINDINNQIQILEDMREALFQRIDEEEDAS